MKITAIRSAGLFGETPKGGWSDEIRPEDSVHALIAVHTDSGAIGLGSAFTDSRLVRAAIEVARTALYRENALEPMRLAEKLSQTTFWMGMGGTLTHTISGIDIALWDILGKSAGQPVGRLLGGRYRDKVRPYASILMEMPDVMRDQAAAFRAKGFRAIKIGWGPFGRSDDPALDEAIVRAAREGAGDDCLLMVDAGASNTFWPHGLKWALRTADMVKEYDAYWLEEASERVRGGGERAAGCSGAAWGLLGRCVT
jgi:D-galactarolactone cycloisomerase